jgi:hydrogenase maturation factor HypF (carbamoyltransferase family)
VAKNDLVRVLVAPGKSIQIQHPDQPLVKDGNGKPFIGVKKTILPGEFFECERQEAERLKRLGVVHMPEGQGAPKPLFGSSDKQEQTIGAA